MAFGAVACSDDTDGGGGGDGGATGGSSGADSGSGGDGSGGDGTGGTGGTGTGTGGSGTGGTGGSDDDGGTGGSDDDGGGVTPDGGEGGLPNPECVQYCEDIADKCQDANEQYDNNGECMMACAEFSREGDEGAYDGNTLWCRLNHLAFIPAQSATTHCPHAGPSGGGECE